MVCFLDYGWGYRRNALPAERQTANMMGIGGGLRIKVMEKWLLRLEWAKILMDEPLTEDAKTRFHISVDFES
jgi:hemolysin activation/secretion protein